MASVSINLDSNNIEADVLTVAESGQSFIVLRLDDTVSLFIAGYDDESVVGARGYCWNAR